MPLISAKQVIVIPNIVNVDNSVDWMCIILLGDGDELAWFN